VRGKNFNRFLLPIAVADGKAAANAIAAAENGALQASAADPPAVSM
jgi:hypothetical protein